MDTALIPDLRAPRLNDGIVQYPERKEINIGVVGIGRMGQQHALNVLRMVPRAKLICACSPAHKDLVWADQHLTPYGVRVVPTFEEMLEIPALEAVIISSASELHPVQTLECLKRGLHVLCEKPVATSVDELEDMVVEAEASPATKVMVAFVRRFDEDYRNALKKIQQGDIGTPVVFRSQACDKLDDSAFFKEYLRTSGGIFIDSTIHDIDLSLAFFGNDSLPKAVWAAGVAAVHTDLKEKCDADNAVGVCEFWGGRIAYFYNSRMSAHGYDNATEIFGTAGKISINLLPRLNRLEVSDASGVRIEPTPGWYDRYVASFVTEVTAFVDAILDNSPVPISLRSSLTSLKIATALQRSLRTGQKIDFDSNGNQI